MWVRLAKWRSRRWTKPFQFTHPCGCDLPICRMSASTTGFNSRTRVGATAWLQWSNSQAPVSIHAPVWVRPFVLLIKLSGKLFQFTHPCGCDSKSMKPIKSSSCFNSRTRVGATRADSRPERSIDGFNSRTRVGATDMDGLFNIIFGVSIHAPVWVRPPAKSRKPTKLGFQFTHPCGCDR